MLHLLETAARNAGELLIPFFQQGVSPQEKGNHQSIVSQADLESQLYIKNFLLEHLPSVGISASQVGFLGEEDLDEKGEYTFVIDPIDGTSNFVSGNSFFAISIACLKDGVVEYGVTYCPLLDLLYIAQLGEGAYLLHNNEKTKLQVKKTELKDATFNTYFSSNTEARQKLFKITDELFTHVRSVRVWGSGTLELAQFAQNLTNIVMYGKCGVWDIAVAKLLIEEAGGSITDWEGKPLELDLSNHDKPYQVLACHPDHLPELTKVISQALSK